MGEAYANYPFSYSLSRIIPPVLIHEELRGGFIDEALSYLGKFIYTCLLCKEFKHPHIKYINGRRYNRDFDFIVRDFTIIEGKVPKKPGHYQFEVEVIHH